MHTQNSVQTSAPKTALKVDNLRHLSDHGLAVQFSDRKLAGLVDYLRDKEGETNLSAGKSTLTITRLGHVTLTRLHLATSGAGYWHETLHYSDARASLSYKVKRQDGTKESNAFDTLRGVIFGPYQTAEPYRYTQTAQTLPPIWFPKCGADADKLRDWLRSYAWTLTGAHGMRAQASKYARSQLEQTIRSAKSALSYRIVELQRLQTENSDSFREQHESARKRCLDRLANSEDGLRSCAEHSANLSETMDEATLRPLASVYGARNISSHWDTEKGCYKYDYGFPSVKACYSHPLRSANYTAQIGADGETISLSSGIACTFGRSAIVSWLRGNSQAPSIKPYGKVEKVECGNLDGKAVVYLKCGCHFVDAATIDAELAELLKPAHTVELTSGQPEALIGSEGFLARLREEIANRASKARENRTNALREFAEKRRALTEREASLPALLSEASARIETARVDVATAESALASAPALLGAPHESNEETARVFLNSQHVNLSL